MSNKFESPQYKKTAFTCPNCSTFSKNDWTGILVNETYGQFAGRLGVSGEKQTINSLYLCKC